MERTGPGGGRGWTQGGQSRPREKVASEPGIEAMNQADPGEGPQAEGAEAANLWGGSTTDILWNVLELAGGAEGCGAG